MLYVVHTVDYEIKHEWNFVQNRSFLIRCQLALFFKIGLILNFIIGFFWGLNYTIYSSVHLRAASNWPLRAPWARTAAPTWLAALLRYGGCSFWNEVSLNLYSLEFTGSKLEWMIQRKFCKITKTRTGIFHLISSVLQNLESPRLLLVIDFSKPNMKRFL